MAVGLVSWTFFDTWFVEGSTLSRQHATIIFNTKRSHCTLSQTGDAVALAGLLSGLTKINVDAAFAKSSETIAAVTTLLGTSWGPLW